MVENWRAVPTYETAYEVSDQGRVRNMKGKVLYTTVGKRGYPVVHLWRHNRSKLTTVHSLVLQAFVGPRPEGQACRHLDGDPLNNALTNLAWGTYSENEHDVVRHGRHPWALKTECPNGHPYTPENTYRRPDNDGRECRQCRAASTVRLRAAKRVQA